MIEGIAHWYAAGGWTSVFEWGSGAVVLAALWLVMIRGAGRRPQV